MYGESTCSDGFNHMVCSLGAYMQKDWGECFQMGGIGGCPYVGKEGYEVLLSHIPDDGNVVILFGPRVDISPEGEVGKFSRVGQKKLSTACGAAIAACNARQRWRLFRSGCRGASGAALMCMIYACGDVSGGHFNPIGS